jgi:hypothetical protein
MDDLRDQVPPFRVGLRYLSQIPHEDVDLIFEFFMVFSRFEFALKQAGYRKVRDGHVSPDWPKFSKKVQNGFSPNESPELRRAFDYYLAVPPQIQVVENDQLSWKDNLKGDTDTDFTWVIRSIGGARNNLFHGGKFPWDPVRDMSILSYGLIILYRCIDLDSNVCNAFYSSP